MSRLRIMEFVLATTAVLSLVIVTETRVPDFGVCFNKFYRESKSWFDAKAICEEGNMTLAHFDHASNYSYVYSVMKSLLPEMFDNPPSSVWVGAYRTAGGTPKWQEDCFSVDEGLLGGNTDSNEACFLLEDSISLKTASCTEQLPFLCQTTDTKECFTTQSTFYDGTTYGNQYARKTASDCITDCMAVHGCLGFKFVPSKCVLITFTAGTSYTKGNTKYMIDLLRTSVPPGIGAIRSDFQDICSSSSTSSQDTPTISPTSSLTSSIMTSELPQSTASVSLTMTASMGSTFDPSYLETSFTEPSNLESTTYITSESTPQLPDTIMSVDLAASSLPSETESLSVSCSNCACYKSTSMNQEELESSIRELKKELSIDPKELSSFKRKMISAPDDRQSAANIGYGGALILCVIPTIVILLDIGRLTREFKQFILRLRNSQRVVADVVPLGRT